MHESAFYVAAHLLIATLYLLLAWRVWVALAAEREGPAQAALQPWALPFLVLAHGALVLFGAMGGDHFRFGFALALSATLWLTVAILWFESFFVSLRGLLPLVLPMAAVALLLPLLFPGGVVATNRTLGFELHLLAAILAYSLLTIAALHATLMAGLDRQLHRGASGPQGEPSRLFRHIPPLLAMERLLFRLIGAGFALLTVTVVSGLLFSEYLFGRALRFEHKTVFALAAWLVFGGLLAGRMIFGWRGRVALRWTLAGFAMLLLAYIGSRFVIEVVFGRG